MAHKKKISEFEEGGERIKLKPVTTGKALLQKVFTQVELDDEMRAALGLIEDSFGIFIDGESGSGKTSMVGELIKALSHLGLVLYESFEEGATLSFRLMLERVGLKPLLESGGIQILDGEPHHHVMYRLNKKKSAKIVIIDSTQYTEWTLPQYKALKEAFMFGKSQKSRKILIFTSHSEGRQPDGYVAKKIKYDSMVKIRMEGYIAFIKSRYMNTKNYCVWPEGARDYWGKDWKDKLWKVKPAKKTRVKGKGNNVVDGDNAGNVKPLTEQHGEDVHQV